MRGQRKAPSSLSRKMLKQLIKNRIKRKGKKLKTHKLSQHDNLICKHNLTTHMEVEGRIEKSLAPWSRPESLCQAKGTTGQGQPA